MRFYVLNFLSLSPAVFLLMVFDGIWGVLLTVAYAGFWLYDFRVSDVPLYRNYPIAGRVQALLYTVLSRFSDTSSPFSSGVLTVIRSYADDVTPYSSFGKQTLPDSDLAIRHVMFPAEHVKRSFRVNIGGQQCSQKYSCSLFNISALSFGSITLNAIETLSKAAEEGCFYYNTGEAGIHQRAIDGGGDLVWQVGTGYFGCRDTKGKFDETIFSQKANLPNVKMIEIKLSQGSKPALGGFLPASKVSQEVADLCGIPMNMDSVLPISHSAFTDVEALPGFIAKLRSLSKRKPIGLKMCVGNINELEYLIQAMKKQNIYPDFISIDSSSGGTGSAPVEYQDTVGTPLFPALTVVDNLLRKYGMREEVRIIASGKVAAARDIFFALAHGADICVAARPFLIAMGCVQAMACESSLCPAGITSSHTWLDKAVQPEKRAQYLVNFHRQMLENFGKLLASAGLYAPSEITLEHLYKK